MPKVFLSADHKHEGGINRCLNALRRHLPAFGWEVVTDPAEADVINTHGADLVEGYEDKPVVQSSHGLMWSDYFDNPLWDSVNAQLVRAMKRADAVTAPSEWVARAIARGMACAPVVIHHGVDAEEWAPQPSEGYALWNKARGDEVSDYREAEKLAALCPDVPFVSTIGTATANLKICGAMPYADMKGVIQRAGVYLALPRETFGIGTLEAMASGVPVVGWDYGGQHEIIRQGETGYLAPYGDYSALAACVRQCLSERARLASNARADVQARWGWEPRIAQYAALFDRLTAPKEAPKVSVIVTSFNLARYLPAALASVLAQTVSDWECVIVDDGSTDDTATVAAEWYKRDRRFRYLRPAHNLGLPAARNYGIERAKGRYIIPLDADDMLAPDALAILSAALDKDKALHIAYGHLDVVNEVGENRTRSQWGVHAFDYAGQLNHHNQLHYSAMCRRTIWERTAGYRRRSWQAEDAEFWGYATSFGFNAQRVTDASTLIYRMRGGSKSSSNAKMGTEWPDGDWSAWYTWRSRPDNTPFGAPRPSTGFWRVPHHADPQVSVVIPVGPAHRELLQDALDSLLAQTFTKWEVVVVNDTAEPLDLRGYGFARVVETKGKRGPAHARNVGTKVAAAPLLIFLDADDFLQPTFLEAVMSAYRADDKPALIYTDWIQEYGTGSADKVWKTADWDWRLLRGGMVNNVTALIPKSAHEAIGGFDETLPGWEDWHYMLKLAESGLCGKRIPHALMTYRYQTGLKRDASYAQLETLKPRILGPFLDYFEGRKEMACTRGCGGGRVNPPPASPQQMNAQSNPGAPTAGMVLLEYVGSSPNTLRFVGRKTQTAYRFGDSPEHRLKYVFAEDAKDLLLQAEGPGRPRFKQAAAPPVIAPMQPLVVRDRVVPPSAPTLDPVMAEIVERPRMPVVAASTPIDAMPYAAIRAMVPALTLPEAEAHLRAERAGKNRAGVVKLLEAHITTLMQEPVMA